MILDLGKSQHLMLEVVVLSGRTSSTSFLPPPLEVLVTWEWDSTEHSPHSLVTEKEEQSTGAAWPQLLHKTHVCCPVQWVWQSTGCALLQRKPTHVDTKAALCTLFFSALDLGMTQILCWSNLPLISASFLLANTPLHSLQDLCVFLSSVSKSKARSFKRDSSTQLVVKLLVMLLSCNFIKD